MTSDLGPRGRGFSRRTTSLNTSRVSPLSSGRSAGGADNRPRMTTSFRSMTARLMQAASPFCSTPARAAHRAVDGPGRCGRRRSLRRWLLLLVGGRLLEQPRVVTLDRRRDLAEQLRHLRLDVGLGDLAADLLGELTSQLVIGGLAGATVAGLVVSQVFVLGHLDVH